MVICKDGIISLILHVASFEVASEHWENQYWIHKSGFFPIKLLLSVHFTAGAYCNSGKRNNIYI